MRTSLLIALMLPGVALACLATPAQAQITGPQYNIVVSITPPSDFLTEGGQLLTMDGRVDFSGDPSMVLNRDGIPVAYTVTQAPEWLVVTVDPANDVIPIAMESGVFVGVRHFSVTAQATSVPPATVTEVIEITATITPSGPFMPPKSAHQQVPIQFVVPEEEEEGDEDYETGFEAGSSSHSGADAQAVAPAEEDDSDLHVQSGGITPIGTWYAAGGFGLVGAGVGLLLRRRFKA